MTISYSKFIERLRAAVARKTKDASKKMVKPISSKKMSTPFEDLHVYDIKQVGSDEIIGSFSFHSHFFSDKRQFISLISYDHGRRMAARLAHKIKKIPHETPIGYYEIAFLEIYPAFRKGETARRAVLDVLEKVNIRRPAVVTFSIDPQSDRMSLAALTRFYRSAFSGVEIGEDANGNPFGFLLLI